MSNWQLKKFKDVVQFPPKISLVKGRSYSFIPMEQINSSYKYVSANQEKIWKGSGGAKFENGDTLFARITPCLQNGKISQVKELKNAIGFGSTEYFIFRGLNNISNSDFIYYLSQTYEFRSYAIGSMVGASGRQRADATFVGNYEFLLPPLPTQRRIASILSAYDDLIENNLKRIKLLEESAQRTYEEWFVKFRVNGEQLIIDEKTGLPEGWEKKKITDFISFRQDKEKIKKFDNQLVYLATADVDGTQITGEGEPITWENKPSRAQKRLVKESVWFARMSNTYKVILANRNFKKDYVISSGFVGFRPKNNNCLPFLFCLINSDDFHSKKDLFATGATQVSLNDVSLSTIELLEPSITTIEMFGKQFNDTLELRQILIDQNQKLKESRDILLPKLMNGTINVQ